MNYITKTNIFTGPRFGSQMTQYAGMYSVAKKMKAEYVFIKEHMQDVVVDGHIFEAFHIPNRIVSEKDIQFSTFTIKEMVMDGDVFYLPTNQNWDIGGWFNTYQYFREYKEEIQSIFTFRDEIRSIALNNINKIRNNEPYPLVSLHVRRGDYLTHFSLVMNLKYYSDALSVFYKELDNNYFKLVVFSDDIPWCKNNIMGENVIYIENNTNYVDMCMMSMCDHNITANSGFSWWGAYLNNSPNKIVVCPYQFIGALDVQHQYMNGAYYPDTWRAIPNNDYV
jgi:hypothetical protein